MIERVLADTGPLVAIFSRQDTYHQSCVKQLSEIRAPLFTCWPVITEAVYLLRKSPDAVNELMNQTLDGGILEILELKKAALSWISAFFKKYQDQEPQLADAALVYLAERENIDRVFTLDRKDFSIYRFKRNQNFRLLPLL